MTEKICPLLGGDCLKERCMLWVHVAGKSPQDNKQIDLHDCAFAWFPVLLLETTKSVRATNDAIEQFRSESRKGNEAFIGLMLRAASRRTREPGGPAPQLPDREPPPAHN